MNVAENLGEHQDREKDVLIAAIIISVFVICSCLFASSCEAAADERKKSLISIVTPNGWVRE